MIEDELYNGYETVKLDILGISTRHHIA